MNTNYRIAWLIPAVKYYWQPSLSEFTNIFPNTKVFTGLFPGFIENLDENNIDIKVVGKFKPIRNNNKNKYSSLFTYLSPKIIQHLIDFKPSIVFSSSFGIWTIIALLLKPFYKWKVVIAYEGSSPTVDFLNSPLRLKIRRNMVKCADSFITNSQKGKEYLIENLQANSSLVFAHPYEIPPLELIKTKTQERSIERRKYERPIFLFVGQIIRRKGIDILLHACLKLIQEGKSNFTVTIVGDGAQRKILENFCEQNNLQNNVQWLGISEYREVNTFYNEADVFVFPSREDTWGVVILEAMLFGKPVISSTSAGSSELIDHGENGYVFNINKPDELTRLMSKFVDRPDLAREMGVKSKQKISNYDPYSSGIFLKNVFDFCFSNI